eukprot:4204281-Amphidinium_carterae.1
MQRSLDVGGDTEDHGGLPIHRWRDGLVKEAIANLCNAKSFAKKLEHCPLTLQDLSPWCLENLLLPTFKTKSIFWLGQSHYHYVAFARRQRVQEAHHDATNVPIPVCKMGSFLDYFRGEAVAKTAPTSTTTARWPRTKWTISSPSLTSWQRTPRSMPDGALRPLGRASIGKLAPT